MMEEREIAVMSWEVFRDAFCGQKQAIVKSLEVDGVCAGEVYWKILCMK